MIELQSIPKCEKKDSLNVGNYTCINNKPAYRICTQKNCPHPSLCCQDDQCSCNEFHSLCTQIRLKSLLQKLYSKVADTSEIMQKVTNLFDSIIDQVSQIYQQTQKKIKRYGLRHAQIKFLQYLEENRSHTLTGKIVHDANQIAGIKYDGEFWQIQNVVDKLWNQLGGLFWGMLYSTKDIYEIPTRVNKLNPDSGEEFYGDVIQQTKAILTSLQDMKIEEKKEIRERNLGETKQKIDDKQIKKKQEQIQKDKELRLQDLGYSDKDEENEQQQLKQRQLNKVGVQHNLKPKISDKIFSIVNNKRRIQQQKPKKGQNQEEDQSRNNLNKPLLQKQQVQQENKQLKGKPYENKPIFSQKQFIEDLRKKNLVYSIWGKNDQMNIIKQKQQPVVNQGSSNQNKNKQKQKPINEPISTQKKDSGISQVDVQRGKQQIILNQQGKLFNQACEYLNDTLGIGLKLSKQFVLKNGFNKEGKLLSMEQILDIALTKGDLF